MVQINLKSLNKESLHLYKTFLIKILEKISIDYKTFDLPTKQKQYREAESRHHAHRQATIESGALVRSGIDYVWKDEHASKPDDPEWVTFYHKYAKFCEDNGIILTNIKTEI